MSFNVRLWTLGVDVPSVFDCVVCSCTHCLCSCSMLVSLSLSLSCVLIVCVYMLGLNACNVSSLFCLRSCPLTTILPLVERSCAFELFRVSNEYTSPTAQCILLFQRAKQSHAPIHTTHQAHAHKTLCQSPNSALDVAVLP